MFASFGMAATIAVFIKDRENTWNTVGASLLAIALCQKMKGD